MITTLTLDSTIMPDCFSVEAAAKDFIARLVSNLTPFDDLERQHIQETLT